MNHEILSILNKRNRQELILPKVHRKLVDISKSLDQSLNFLLSRQMTGQNDNNEGCT